MMIYNFLSIPCRSEKNQKTIKWMSTDYNAIFLSVVYIFFTQKDIKRCHHNQIVFHKIYKQCNQEKETDYTVTN